MPTVHITTNGGESIEAEVVGEWPDYESVVEAHGYDASAVEWSVDDPDADLQDAIQNASNLQELKGALTSSEHPAQAKGRGQ